MSKATHLLKNAGILAIGNFSSKILIFLLVPVYTAVLSTAEYGSYDIIVSAIGLLMPILTLNVADALLRFPMDEDANIPGIVRVGLVLTLGSSILVGLAQLVPCAPWMQLPGAPYIAPLYFATALYQALVALSRGLERMADIAVAGFLSAALVLGLSAVLLLVLKMGLPGYFVANIAGLLVPALFLLFRQRRVIFANGSSLFDPKLAKRMVLYSMPLALTIVGWWFINTSGRFVVTWVCGLSENGLFSVAYKIPAVLSALVGVFMQAWQVSAVKEFDENDSDGFLGNMYVSVELALMALCSFVVALSPLIGTVLFEGDFREAWMYAPFLVISATANSLAGVFAPFFSAKMITRPMVESTLASGIACVVFSVVLAFVFGVQGVAFASMVSCVINWLYRGIKAGEVIAIDFRLLRTMNVFLLLSLQGIARIYILGVWSDVLQVIALCSILFVYRGELLELIRRMKFLRRG